MTPTPLDTGTLELRDERHETSSLLSQIAWFNRLRLLVAASVVWLTALAAHGLRLVYTPRPLYLLAGGIALVDLIYIAIFRRLRRWPLARVRRHVYLQIAVDLLLLTALLHWSGGVTNPLALFFLFHAFIAALVLSTRAAVVVATASLVLLVGLGGLERLGWISHHALPLGLMDLHTVQPLGLWLLVFAYAATLAFSVYFVTTVLARLRDRERQIVGISRHLATSEKLASVGTLVAGISHEINNPIGVITNKVQILRYRIADGDDAAALAAELDVIDKHARRIAQITAGLLTFSRDTPFEVGAVAVDSLLREAADLVKVPFRTAGVELACDVLAPDVVVRGSANHLLQVLVNILLNAKDASRVGGAVRLDCLVGDDEVALRVADRGVGIAPEHLQKVFDPFFTTKDVDKGTGLGLAISHGIIERHGGRIEVESVVDVGTTFRVVLPLPIR